MYTSRRNRQSDICGEWAFLKCKLIFANFSWQGAPQVCYYRAGPGLCVVLFGEASCLFLCLMGRPEVGMVTIYRQRLCHSALHVIWGTLGTVTSKRQLCIVQYVRSQLWRTSHLQICFVLSANYVTNIPQINEILYNLFGTAIIPATYIHENLFSVWGSGVQDYLYKPVYNTLGFVCRESLSEPSTLGSIVVASSCSVHPTTHVHLNSLLWSPPSNTKP